jgi:hypothetical protein
MLCLLELHYCGVLSNQAFAQCSVYLTRQPIGKQESHLQVPFL